MSHQSSFMGEVGSIGLLASPFTQFFNNPLGPYCKLSSSTGEVVGFIRGELIKWRT